MYVFWLLLLATCSEGKPTETATCESTVLGEPARVTCQFSENVVEDVDVSAVLLRRFPIHNKAGNVVQKVVECHRYIDNVFDCLPRNGYGVIGTVSDQMIINIVRAQPEHQSLFSCELVRRQTTEQVAVCVLKYEDTLENISTTSPPPPVQESDDQQKEVSDNCTKDDTGWNHRTTVLAVFVVLELVLLLLSVLINFYLARKLIQNRCCSRKRQTSKEEKENGQEETKHLKEITSVESNPSDLSEQIQDLVDSQPS